MSVDLASSIGAHLCQECGQRVIHARGLCNGCYKRAQRGAEFEPRRAKAGQVCGDCAKPLCRDNQSGYCRRCLPARLHPPRFCACGRKVEARGLCATCYVRIRKAAIRAALPPKPARVRALCSDCGTRVAHARGLCKTCYVRARYHERRDQPRPPARIGRPPLPPKLCADCGQRLSDRQRQRCRACYLRSFARPIKQEPKPAKVPAPRPATIKPPTIQYARHSKPAAVKVVAPSPVTHTEAMSSAKGGHAHRGIPAPAPRLDSRDRSKCSTHHVALVPLAEPLRDATAGELMKCPIAHCLYFGWRLGDTWDILTPEPIASVAA